MLIRIAPWQDGRGGPKPLISGKARPPRNPPTQPGGLVLASVTVTGTNISGVDTSLNYPNTKVAYGGTNGQLAFSSALTWNGSTLHVGGTVEAVAHTVLDYAGNNATAFYSTLNATGGANRWLIYGAGTAPSYMGGTLSVAGAGSFSGTLGVSGATTLQSTLWVTSGATLNTTLVVNGATTLNSTLYVGGALTANTTIYANGQIQGGSFTTGSTIYCAGLATLTSVSTGNLYVSGTGTFDGLVNMGSTAGHKLNVGGNIYVTNGIGIGRGAEGGWSLTTNGGLLSYGAIQGNSSLYIATTGTFLGNVAVASTNTTTYQLLVAGTAGKIGGGSWSDVSSRQLKREITDIPDALALLLTQRGRRYEWDEPEHAALLPGPQHGFVYDEVTIPQWRDVGPGGEEILTLRGSEALFVEALRTIVERLEALEEER